MSKLLDSLKGKTSLADVQRGGAVDLGGSDTQVLHPGGPPRPPAHTGQPAGAGDEAALASQPAHPPAEAAPPGQPAREASEGGHTGRARRAAGTPAHVGRAATLDALATPAEARAIDKVTIELDQTLHARLVTLVRSRGGLTKRKVVEAALDAFISDAGY
jgi:hypothetical protein